MHDADVGAIVAGLTQAQREALVRLDDRVWSYSELHHATRESLFRRGLLGKLFAAGHRFIRWTPAGEAVRARILANADAGGGA